MNTYSQNKYNILSVDTEDRFDEPTNVELEPIPHVQHNPFEIEEVKEPAQSPNIENPIFRPIGSYNWGDESESECEEEIDTSWKEVSRQCTWKEKTEQDFSEIQQPQRKTAVKYRKPKVDKKVYAFTGKKTRMCEAGDNCKYGVRCNKAHTIEELEPVECSFAEECIKRRCRYYHPHKETKEMWIERFTEMMKEYKLEKAKIEKEAMITTSYMNLME